VDWPGTLASLLEDVHDSRQLYRDGSSECEQDGNGEDEPAEAHAFLHDALLVGDGEDGLGGNTVKG